MSNEIQEPQVQISSRVMQFTRAEREAGVHPVIRALHSRPLTRDADTNRRAIEYARIARGHMA